MNGVMYALLGVVITEGVGFITALIRVSYHAGKVLQWIEGAEHRLQELEENSHTHNPGIEPEQGGDL